jgi:tRNA(Ile)-lysidine synthase
MPLLEDALGPGVATALARTAELAREQADALDELAAELLERAAASPEGRGWDVATLAAAPGGLRRAALHAAALAAGATGGALSRTHVLALDALLVDWRGQGPVALPGGVEAVRRCGRLFLQRGTTHE